MVLLIGPPGSGKTQQVLARVRQAVRRGRSNFRLLVPTATMAEHLRNRMAREGFVFRPGLITTLSKFIEPWVADLPEVPDASLELLVEAALKRLSPAAFQNVAGFSGFRACLVRVIGEISSAGYDSRDLAAALAGQPRKPIEAVALADVLGEVEAALARLGLALRSGRLKQAAGKIRSSGLSGIEAVYFDGFFLLTAPELEVVDALRRHADVTITLPSWTGSEMSRDRLLAMGFQPQQCEKVRPEPHVVVMPAPTMEQEVEEIARRILDQAASGRPFREMGIVVRNREPYVPALRTTLERFGIPARFYAARLLAEHPLVQYLTGAVDAMLGGWDHEQTLAVLRMTASGLGASTGMDRFDFRVRKRLPGQGLDGLRELARDRRLVALLDAFARLESWRNFSGSPAEWADRAGGLRSLFHPARPAEPATHEMAGIWRGYAAALEAFDAAIREAASILEPARNLPFADFWRQAKAVLRLTELRIPDNRRNVVNVLDVHEARQWELPVVFVCGLLERQFPLYHAQDPILPDDLRRRLAKGGLHLRTAAERDQHERFLFELATTRAGSMLFLTYPRFNRKGDSNVKSVYLEAFPDGASASDAEPLCRRTRPQSARPRAVEKRPVIYGEDLRRWLLERHAAMSPTAVETFLQCPFQFFARHTLELEAPPPAAFERLDALVQGTIVHESLARWLPEGGPIEPVFRSVFEDVCRRERIPSGYRTEAVRLELLRNLQRFAEQPPLPGVWKSEAEHSFELELDESLRIRGRIDRIDVAPDGKALVIDYKYSAGERIRKRVKGHEEGRQVQGGLYMFATGRETGREVAGMFFAGLRNGVSWEGWHVALEGFEKMGEARRPEDLRELVEQSRQLTLEAAAQVRAGRVEPHPADPDLCEHCEFRDICRVETAALVTAAWSREL